MTTIIGVKLHHRMQKATDLQEILSKHGCNIKTRIGLHHVEEGICSPNGIIVLEVIGKDEEISALETDLKNIEGADVQKMAF